jgi:DNA-binding IclR family transcriptional regulator
VPRRPSGATVADTGDVASAPARTVQSVERALHVLEIMAGGPVTVSEVARDLDVGPSSASRLLSTMERSGFVSRDPSGAFRLGPRIGSLGFAYAQHYHPARDLGPLLDQIVERSEETVILAVLEGSAARIVDQRQSPHPLSSSARIGGLTPLHCGAAGKAILAFLPDEQIRTLVSTKPLQRFTANTLTTPDELFAEIATIRNSGFSLSVEEIDEGVAGLAVPVAGGDGASVGAVSITAPKLRFDDDRMTELVGVLRDVLGAHLLRWSADAAR